MVLSPDSLVVFLSYVLYCTQYLGVALGVGAETVLLVSYIAATRDGVVERSEERMALAVRRVLNWGLVIMIVSGLVTTAIHFASGEEYSTVFTAAYLFKWALIVVVLLFNSVLRHTMPLTALEGLAAGSWYAIFLDHILAIDVSWMLLLQWYAVWMIGFNIVWWALVLMLKGSAPLPQGSFTSAKLVSTSASTNVPVYKPAPKPAPVSTPAPITTPPPAVATPPPPKKSLFNFFASRPKPVVAPSTPATPTNLPVFQPAPAAPPPKPAPQQYTPPTVTTPSPAAAPILKLTPVLEKMNKTEAAAADQQSGLPTIRVMPKAPEQVTP